MAIIAYFCKRHTLKMKDSALSVANYFIDLANQERVEIKPLKLMKLVYIAHGFMLAIMDRSVFNPRFDIVEAWKYGPVVPSVYHSFKSFGNSPITEKTVVFESTDDIFSAANVSTPDLQDEDAKAICEFVWERYGGATDNQLVTILHGSNTPWARTYQEGMNNEIPDRLTMLYYKNLIKVILGPDDER